MHKSVPLSLFLMGSLIMLVSFTSMNIFSNAMAQGYDNNYYEDRYYEKPNSYSYHYNNEEKYSDYPSQVNKYECQKGPLEGFFVSSPEFCILKTKQALDKDNDRIKDKDNDSINDNDDNCPTSPNRDQSDNDKDGIGDVCDPTPNGPPDPNPSQNTTEIWVNPNFNPQSFIDVQKVQLFCEAANCASTINTSQKSTYAIIVVGKDPFSAYCEDPGLSPCAYALIEGPSIGQHSNKLFGSIINQGSPSDRSTNFYLITLEFNGTNLFFTADNHIGCASNLSSCDQFYSTGTKQPLVLEIRKPI